MERYYYLRNIKDFIKDDSNYILGKITKNNEFNLEKTQRNAWIEQITILKNNLFKYNDGKLIFEYVIPRVGKRIDNVLIYKGFIFLLEFKVGENKYSLQDQEQVLDYALDLKNFHEESYDKKIIPILISTKAKEHKNNYEFHEDNIMNIVLCNKENIFENIENIINRYKSEEIDYEKWIKSRYKPTPTIIEAAQALYKGHNVKEISRSDAGAKNLNESTEYINKVIDYSKTNNKKSICFLTGVPGAGKTLAGLNIASLRQKYEEEEHAVFLSGNGPLVDVLREALALDDSESNNITKGEARRKSKTFIQPIHHFRDEALNTEEPLLEKVVIFDEAQRAWNKDKTVKFMKEKYEDFNKSEPNYLISILDRQKDWAVIICLIGGGQEIHTGEAGLKEWFKSIENYSDWEVYVSDKIIDKEYLNLQSKEDLIINNKLEITDKLHLNTSLRSFRSENLSNLVKNILDLKLEASIDLYEKLKDKYPIYLTRDLSTAKKWLVNKARGSERYGIVASSGARRLKAEGLDVKGEIKAENWFLNNRRDVRSSYYMEDVATEFDIQGLELDWTCLAWGADFRIENNKWTYKNFRGCRWENINKKSDILYKKNSYRVLLTRARQGMIIYIPKGEDKDWTRPSKYYDETFNYLNKIGIPTI